MTIVDRVEELAALRSVYTEVRSGKGRVVLLCGGLAGGKTALLSHYCDQTAVDGALVLMATGARAERRLSMGLIDQLFQSAALPPEIVDRARQLMAVDPSRAPGGDDEPITSSSAARTAHALCDLLLRLTASAPVVIGIDDVHFVDDASLQVLLYLCRRLRRARIMLILTEWARPLPTQPLFRAELTRLPHLIIGLRPLSVDGVRELVAALTGCPVSAALARRYHEHAGGNPLLVRALVMDNPIDPDDLGGAVAERLTAGSVYREAVLSCLHRWEPRLLTVARAVAILREHASLDLVAALAQLTPETVAQILAVLTDAGLLAGLWFRHEQAAAAVLDALAARERATLHLRAAEILYPRGTTAVDVGRHLIAGAGVPAPWAVLVLRAAAEQALEVDDVDLAVSALDLALSGCGEDQDVTVELTVASAAALWRMNPEMAGVRLAPLRPLLRDNRLTAAQARVVLRFLLWQGAVDECRAVWPVPVDSAGPDIAPEMIALALGYPYANENGETGPVAKQIAGAADDPWIEAGLSLCTGGYDAPPEKIVEHATQILRSCRLDDTTLEVVAVSIGALAQVESLDLALDWCEKLVAEATRRGATTWRALLTAVRAAVVLGTGDLEHAAVLAADALHSLSSPSWGVIIGLPLSVLLTANTGLGRHEQAEQLLRHAAPAAASETLLGTNYLRARGRHYLATGRTLAAMADFTECGRRLRAWDMDRPELVPWRTDQAEAHLSLAHREVARDLAKEQLKRTRNARCRGLSIRVLAACSEPKDRPRLLNVAIDALQDSGDRAELALAMVELSQAYDELGDFARARMVARSVDPEIRADRMIVPRTQIVTVLDGPTEDGPTVAEAMTAGAMADGATMLSDAELRVARLAARGYTNREISRRLNITSSTVEQHLTRVYRKLNVSSRADLPEQLFAVSANAEPRHFGSGQCG